MQLVIMGFVTAESVVRLWASEGWSDWFVEDDGGLRDALGVGRVDREPTVPDAQTEIGLLDEDEGQLYLAAPFEAGERPRVAAGPFGVARVRVGHGAAGSPGLPWSEETLGVLVDWLAETIAARAPHGEDVVLHERDVDGRGRRVVSASFVDRDGVLTSVVATNLVPPEDRLWAQARTPDGGGVLSAPATGSSPRDAAKLLARVAATWPGGPLGLVCSWDASGEPC